MNTYRYIAGALCGSLCQLVVAAVPVLSNVAVSQDAATRIVTVTYTLANAPAIVTADFLTNAVSIGGGAYRQLSGDVNKVLSEDGSYSFTWNPVIDWPDHELTGLSVTLTPWTTNAPPPYMVVALKPYASVSTYDIAYYPSEESLPWGGVTNNAARERFLVLKRINAANVTFQMGAVKGDMGRDNNSGKESGDGPERIHNVTLSSDFYIGVFEVTFGQWCLITGSQSPSGCFVQVLADKAGRPRDRISYCHIRECDSTLTNGETNEAHLYPQAPHSGSFMGKLRSRTGNLPFDLPSEAQWEFASYGGNYAANTWGDGSARTTSINKDANLCNLARFKQNDGYIDGSTAPADSVGATNATAIVGTYMPNSYGLYDMHGNVWEICLDWYAEDIAGLNGAVNADGANLADGTTAGTARVMRGGSYQTNPASCRSQWRTTTCTPASHDKQRGFRVALQLPAPDGAASPVAVTATLAALDSRTATESDLVIPDFSTFEVGTIIVIR